MLTIEQLKKYHNYIYYVYSKQMTIEFREKSKIDDFYSYVEKRIVVLPKKIIQNPSEWSLFAFLHEIGHILTNTSKMKRCEQEYAATQWALDEARKIGFAVPYGFIVTYQNYIWNWREKSIRLKGNNIPSKDELSLIR